MDDTKGKNWMEEQERPHWSSVHHAVGHRWQEWARRLTMPDADYVAFPDEASAERWFKDLLEDSSPAQVAYQETENGPTMYGVPVRFVEPSKKP
jgi:hypothetical protein